MGLNFNLLPKINNRKFKMLDGDTRELIDEFYSGLHADCPTYNGSMMIFRTLLVHFYWELSGETDVSNFTEVIELLDDEIDFEYDYYNSLLNLKNEVNDIIHNFNVLYNGDEQIIYDAWDFIKWMVECILNED